MGTPPNASIVLTPAELAFIDAQFGGSRSSAIHAALSAIMHNAGRPYIVVRQTGRGEWLVCENHGGQTGRQFGRFPDEQSARRYADWLADERQRPDVAALVPQPESPPPVDWYEAADKLSNEDAGREERDA